jgi:RNA polymerase sigma-70 factor (ECF subfamily)
MDAHRKRGRDRTIGGHDSGDRAGAGAGPPDPFDPGLVEALDALSADQREVLVLRFVADLSLEAVAKITRRRVGAVKALQHRALENLRRAVSPDD